MRMTRVELLERLSEIEERAKRATNGPWGLSRTQRKTVSVVAGMRLYYEQKGQRSGSAAGSIARNVNPENGEFIANARSDIPWLASKLRQALGED